MDQSYLSTDLLMCALDTPTEILDIIQTKINTILGYVIIDDVTDEHDRDTINELEKITCIPGHRIIPEKYAKRVMKEPKYQNTIKIRNQSTKEIIVIISSLYCDLCELYQDSPNEFPRLRFNRPSSFFKLILTLPSQKSIILPTKYMACYVSMGKFQQSDFEHTYFQFYAIEHRLINVGTQLTMYDAYYSSPLRMLTLKN